MKASAPRSLGAGILLLAMAGCDSSPGASTSTSAVVPAAFATSGSAVAIGSTIARLAPDDPRAMFGSVAAMLRIESGYVVADGRNQELVFLDRELNPVKKVGRHGEGPGEYQFPSALATNDDLIAVLETGLNRVYYLTSDGDLVRSFQLSGDTDDLVVHPELGLLVTGNAFPDYYTTRVTKDGQIGFGPIPAAFRADARVSRFRPRNLVAATSDGILHVLDGEQLAMVSFDVDGNQTDLVFLPEEIRVSKLEDRASGTEAFGGPAVVLSWSFVSDFDAIPDGRLFIRIGYKDAIGFVLDPGSREAIPILMPPSERVWMRNSSSTYFDGERMVLTEDLGGIRLVETRSP